MAAVLAGAGTFVYAQLRTDLDDRVDTVLEARAADAALAATRREGLTGFAVAEESFAQILGPRGRLLDRDGGPPAPALAGDELARAGVAPVHLERRLPGVDATARLLARPVTDRPGADIVVVGQSLEDRDEALAGVVRSFAIGGPVAVALASVIGYLLAAAGLRPVEAMRRRAGEVALADGDDLLPLPMAQDEVRRLGETLNEMLDRLRRSYDRERRFVADASHELRTPLAVVKLELEGALRAGGHDPEVHESLLTALEECDNLAQLAEDLLVLARAGEGALAVRPEALSARAVLEDVCARFEDRAALHGRRVAADADPALIMSADPLRIRQALGNLVDNALRHGRGAVALRARAEPGGVAVSVADEGPGFADEIASRAFERFARADRARAGGGAGLGLAIVRAIAEAHGGSAAIVPDRGATVRLWFPGEPDGPQGSLSRPSYGARATAPRPRRAP